MKTIAVDFDGTCVAYYFPLIGHEIGAVDVLKALVENGCKLILLTMREDKPMTVATGTSIEVINPLEDAVMWFKKNGIPLYGVNENPDQTWSSSRKVYASYYIDDSALGVPLTCGHVDWHRMIDILETKKLLAPEQAEELSRNFKYC